MSYIDERRREIERSIDWMEKEYVKKCTERGAKKIIPFKTMMRGYITFFVLWIIAVVLGIVMFYR